MIDVVQFCLTECLSLTWFLGKGSGPGVTADTRDPELHRESKLSGLHVKTLPPPNQNEQTNKQTKCVSRLLFGNSDHRVEARQGSFICLQT